MDERCDIAVIGAGAAGLAAAIFAAEAIRRLPTGPSARIIVLEGASSVGAKILISGGGRCNVTHDVVHPADFNGPGPVVRNVLAAFDAQAAARWFTALGVPLKREDTGKLFPVSDRARTVLEALLRRCADLAVDIRSAHRVHALVAAESKAPFVVEHQHGVLHAPQVIMATGGRSLPRTGSDGAGWHLVERLGHTVTPTYPALVPLLLQGDLHRSLSGMSQLTELSTFADDHLIDRRTGSMLWTHFGVSGPVVMDASRHWVIAHATGRRMELRCNFFPGLDFAGAEQWVLTAAAARPRTSLLRLLAARLPERLAAALLERSQVDPATRATELARPQRRALVHALTAFALPVVGARGWDFAEVTAGGVPLAEVDYRSMASRRVAGLYLVGEMLDCDGRIGGFNFQWAWSTGYVAGCAAGRAVQARMP